MRVMLCLLIVFLASCSAKKDVGHFYDQGGNTLEVYDSKYDAVASFFGVHSPSKVTVHYNESLTSNFNADKNTISISTKSLSEDSLQLAIHLASNIAMANLSRGGSTLEEFRFFDEGLSSIIAHEAIGELRKYKQFAIDEAHRQLNADNLSIGKIQHWTAYYGKWRGKNKNFKRTSYAYPVASCFVLYLLDTYGEVVTKKYFASLGETKSIKVSTEKVLGTTLNLLEQEWIAFIKKRSDLE